MNRRILVVVVALFLASLAVAADANREWKNGTVLVEFVVGKDGRPTKIKVIEASDKKLAASVIEAVEKWHFDKKFAGQKVRQPVEFRVEPPNQKKS